MDNYEVYQLCQYILNEEESGNALAPTDFSRLLRVCSLELARQVFKQYEEGQENTDAVHRFKRMEHLTFIHGAADLPEDYYRKSYMYALGDETPDPEDPSYGTVEKVFVDFCSDYEFGIRDTRYLTGPTLEYPIANIFAGQIRIRPIDIEGALFYYLKQPNEPFFDYYFDANGRVVFFDDSYVLQGGETSRDGESTEGDTITSENVDLDWNENEQLRIVGMICSKAGANLKEAQVIEYAELYKQQQT